MKTRWKFLNWVRQSQFLHHKLLFYMAISLHMHLKPVLRKVTVNCADKWFNGIIQQAKNSLITGNSLPVILQCIVKQDSTYLFTFQCNFF